MNSNTDLLGRPKRSDVISLATAACHITFVFCPIYLAAAVGPSALFAFFWLWFGATMAGLLNLMHECAHYHTFRRRWGSNLLGQWVLAPLVLADFENYRQLHWAHHRNLGGDNDPKYSYTVDIRRGRLLQFFLRCLIGAEALRKFSYQNTERATTKLASSNFWMARVLIVHSVFAGSLLLTAMRFNADLASAIVSAMVAYLFVYLYGLASLTLFMATLRSIAEHQFAADNHAASGHAALRNLDCGVIERLLFGCYGFAEHATHHRNPAIPSYHLAEATKELAILDTTLTPGLTYRKILLMQAWPDVLRNNRPTSIGQTSG
jgi:fatty acid desaturase